MPELSIIVPIFNAASYLDACISSILKQTFKNIEIICINDGSTDNSLNILKEWSSKDSRIKVISQKNKGNSCARNIGLVNARGKFITFVDADDMIKPEMYESLLTKMVNDSLDVIGCTYETYPSLKRKMFSFKTEEIVSFEELLRSNDKIQSSNDLCFCWRYIIRNVIITNNNISFNEKINYGEDMIFITEVLSHCNRIFLTNNSYYYYRTNNNNSMMSSKQYNPNKALSYNLMYLTKVDQIDRMNIDKYTPYSDDLAKYAIYEYLPFLIKNEYSNKDKKKRKENIKDIYSLPIIRDSFRRLGYKNIYPSKKEYFFYIIQKFNIIPLIMYIYNRFYK